MGDLAMRRLIKYNIDRVKVDGQVVAIRLLINYGKVKQMEHQVQFVVTESVIEEDAIQAAKEYADTFLRRINKGYGCQIKPAIDELYNTIQRNNEERVKRDTARGNASNDVQAVLARYAPKKPVYGYENTLGEQL